MAFDQSGVSQPTQIVRISAETGEKTLLLTSPDAEGSGRRDWATNSGNGSLAISPDGHRLAFAHISAQNSTLYLVGLSPQMMPTERPAKLMVEVNQVKGMAWDPDGRSLVVSSNRRGIRELWRVPVTPSGEPTRLNVSGDDPSDIAISATGQHLNASAKWDVYVVSSDGGRPVRLTASLASNIRPNWSHDGRSIYYCSSQGGRAQIWKKPVSGGEPVQVTKNGGCEARESPDGGTLYYLKDETTLWEVPVNGGDEIEVSDLGHGYKSQFTLGKYGIYFIDSFAATTLKFLAFRTHSIKIISKFPGPIASGLAVSPDGDWLLYVERDSEGSQLMLVDKVH